MMNSRQPFQRTNPSSPQPTTHTVSADHQPNIVDESIGIDPRYIEYCNSSKLIPNAILQPDVKTNIVDDGYIPVKYLGGIAFALIVVLGESFLILSDQQALENELLMHQTEQTLVLKEMNRKHTELETTVVKQSAKYEIFKSKLMRLENQLILLSSSVRKLGNRNDK